MTESRGEAPVPDRPVEPYADPSPDSAAPDPPAPDPAAPGSAASPYAGPDAPVSPDAPVPPSSETDEWQRLDARMLLLGPVKAVKEIAFPLVVAAVGISATTDQPPLGVVAGGAVLMIFVGVMPWLTTRYQLTDTQLQVRTGLINKKLLTARMDRVRSVDVTAQLWHRLLGLAKVEVGTGVDATRIELDALNTTQAEELAAALRQRSARARALSSPQRSAYAASSEAIETDRAADSQAEGSPTEATVLATFDPSWARFAPLSLSRLVVVFGALGVFAQFASTGAIIDAALAGYRELAILGAAAAAIIVVLTALVSWAVFSIGAFLVAWWGLRLAADHDTVQLRAGMITTRQTTLEQAKVRGVVIEETILLRLARGGQLTALATGVGVGGATALLPPAPIGVCRDVGQEVLRRSAPSDGSGAEAMDAQATDPLECRLLSHGSAARRRCHVRAQAAQLFWIGVVGVLWWRFDPSWWVTATAVIALVGWGVLVGEQAYRHLGHAVTSQHLVSGDGLLTRRRTVIERAGILGWVVTQNVFQRRAGLVTLVAPLAAGQEQVTIRDVPVASALALAEAATPRLVAPFAVASAR